MTYQLANDFQRCSDCVPGVECPADQLVAALGDGTVSRPDMGRSEDITAEARPVGNDWHVECKMHPYPAPNREYKVGSGYLEQTDLDTK